jgi:hypothetical protein
LYSTKLHQPSTHGTRRNHNHNQNCEHIVPSAMQTEFYVCKKFTKYSVQALLCDNPRQAARRSSRVHLVEGLSDHTPILLTTLTLRPPCKRPFKFELAWLHMEGFSDLVKEVWESHVTGRTPSRTGIINCVQRVDFSVDGRDTCLDG